MQPGLIIFVVSIYEVKPTFYMGLISFIPDELLPLPRASTQRDEFLVCVSVRLSLPQVRITKTHF